MPLTAKQVKTRLTRLRPHLENCSLETLRRGQDALGDIMRTVGRRQVVVKQHSFAAFRGAWAIPRDPRREGVVLYLHGGGYASGGLDYALGFGSRLAWEWGVHVFCAAYRLAPEHPAPAALEDALESYRYLLDKGYAPEQISLCGESAGGGLCYSLCLQLQRLGMQLPGSVLAISPWVDLTLSGESCRDNRDSDVSLTVKQLEFFADCYTDDPRDPLVSPLFADLTGMPPSLIFAGGDELLLSDAKSLHECLSACGCQSELVVRPQRWHGYVLYGLAEDREDVVHINTFFNRHLSQERKLRWMRLDNAAKIYPASRSKSWSNVFRLSATLTEPVDTALLQSALDVTVRRFPSIATRLRRGVFWYYLQQLSHPPQIRTESSYPLTPMSRDEVRTCAFRVIAYDKRIAVEFFHAVTDGTGGLIFLKTLVAEYLQQKYGISVKAEHGVLPRLEPPREEELEDSFLKYAGTVNASRRENDAWHPQGTPEADGYVNLTCFRLDPQQVRQKSKSYGVSVTAFICAVVMQALQQMQGKQVADPRRRKCIRVLVPVNLRNLFPSKSLRNFALYTVPEIDPRLGEYTLEEICRVVHHRMGLEVEPKIMGTKIAVNVSSERSMAVRLMPLPLKNFIMKAVFKAVGERKSCLSLSNLGLVKLPEEMEGYVERLDFILGVQATKLHNCGIITYGDNMYINFVRSIREPELEARFFGILRDLGLGVEVQSNAR